MILRLLLWAACLAAAPALSAGERWTKLSTPHFEMYSSYGVKESEAVLQVLEQARSFFVDNSPTTGQPKLPVRIVTLKSRAEFRHFSGNAAAAAYFQRSHICEYIVMQEITPMFYAGAIHEYTHLFLDQMSIKWPLWLDEGLADVYSSLRPMGNRLMVGTPPPGRIQSLFSGQWLDLRAVLAATKQSPIYNQRGEMGPFYAESWALAHMLLLGPKYRGGFTQFLGMIAVGKSAEEAFKQVYGRSMEEVTSDLRGYFLSGTLTVTFFPMHMAGGDLDVKVSEPAPLETDVVLADLLSAHPDTAQEARDRLAKLEAEIPANADVEASLAYLDWQQGNQKEALKHFHKAVENGARNPVLCFEYATLLFMNAAPAPEVTEVLKRAVALQPNYIEARYSLGMEAVEQGDCELAITNLKAITTMKPDRAYPYYSSLAYCDAKLGNLDEAKRMTALAEQYARDPKERSRAEDFLNQLKAMPARPGQ